MNGENGASLVAELALTKKLLALAEAQALAAQRNLVNVLSGVEGAMVIVDKQHCIRNFSPKARLILNLVNDDVGRPIYEILPTLALQWLDQKVAEVIGGLPIYEEELKNDNGQWRRVQIRPYRAVDDSIDGAVISIVDIDVLKRAVGAAEWARDYAQATVEAMQTPLLLLDDSLRVLSANEAFHEHFGVLAIESEGQCLSKVMKGAWDIPALHDALEAVVTCAQRFHALEVRREIDGVGECYISLSGSAVPSPNGGKLVLLAVEDITDRARGELDRARLLEQSASAQASAEAANRTKDVFLATLSHELRTPLSSLMLQAQLLGRGKLDEAKLKKAAGVIERAARAQAQLIDDLLDISRIVAGKLRIGMLPVGMADVAQIALETVAANAERKRLILSLQLTEPLPVVSGDSLRLQQVVLNLLNNAIKFTPNEGRIVVTVGTVNGQAELCVVDSGIGIEPAFLPSVFDRFSQASPDQNNTHGGLGLGLAIVRQLVQAHGGSVVAESEGQAKGTVFRVRLPLLQGKVEPASASASPSNDARAASLAGRCILIAEDDTAMREGLLEMLTVLGGEVLAAESACQAFNLFEQRVPDLMVLDLAMPDEDGYSLIRRIRARGPSLGGNVPAIALTALVGDEHRQRALAAGFQLHLAKPVEMDRLLFSMSSLLPHPIGPSC